MSLSIARHSLAAASLVFAVGLPAMAGSVMNDFNLIVTENLQGVAEVEGRTFVGGDLAITNAAQFGFDLTPSQVSANGDTLVVAGNVTAVNAGTVKVSKGNMKLNGSVNSSNVVEFQGGGSFQAFDYDVNAVRSELSSFSSFLQAKSAGTATIAFPNSNKAVLTAGTLDGDGFSVLNISANTLFGSGLNYAIELDPGTTGTLVINVSGTNINWANGANMTLPTTDDARSRIIWNFYEATSIFVQGKSFIGSLLAPLALLSSSGGDFNGTVAVRSLNISAEVHNPSYAGPGESTIVVPLPAAAWLGIALFGSVGFKLLRTRRDA